MERVKYYLDKTVMNRLVFKTLMVVAMMITAVPSLHKAMGGYVKLLLGYGLVIIAYEIITKRFFALFKDKLNLLLFGFWGAYLITVLLNRASNFSGNFKALLYMGVIFVLLFMSCERSKEKTVKEIKFISAVFLVCCFVLSAACMLTFILSIAGPYETPSGFLIYGMIDNRMWGIYNANTGATLNSIAILISVGLLFSKPKKLGAVLIWINMIFQLCCLLLTGSRAPLYSLVAVLAAFTAVMLAKRLWQGGRLKAVCAGALAAVIFVFGFMGLAKITKSGLSYLPSISQGLTISDGDFELEKVELDRLEEIEGRPGGIFTGRTTIWKACLSAYKDAPLFGVGRENVAKYAVPRLEDRLWANNIRVGGPHSIYVCILLSSGAVGFLIMGAFAVWLLLRSGRAAIKSFERLSPWLLVCLLLILMFFVMEFVESRILYQVGIFYILFWLYAGYLNETAKQSLKKDGEDI